ncbi:MAG TPA: LysM peptidoglycan-binding domain-containing protein [Polyangia bacterium]|jgi:hypothetical protein|nr:LysM peptidoglycan-binding domain-containing protein [Polyangia bacterium]
MALQRATLTNVSARTPWSIEVMFNPTEYSITRGANYADQPVPGLSMPILQFLRGETQELEIELFLDSTNLAAPDPGQIPPMPPPGTVAPSQAPPQSKTNGMSVEFALTWIRKFIEIDGELHAPPVCRFDWGRVHFQGVMSSLKEKFQLFAEDGEVIRARLEVKFKSYQSAEVQQRELNLASPDRTRAETLREGETLQQLAARAYGDPSQWRVIAEANDIDRPRFVPVGMTLKIPAL